MYLKHYFIVLAVFVLSTQVKCLKLLLWKYILSIFVELNGILLKFQASPFFFGGGNDKDEEVIFIQNILIVWKYIHTYNKSSNSKYNFLSDC